MTAQSEATEKIRAGYTFTTPSIDLGVLVVDGVPDPDVRIRLSLSMLNRHGLVAGATGTGKTRTLQLLAEAISAAGVSVFAADIKGDLSGIAIPGEPSEKLMARTQRIGQDWKPAGCPTEFYALGGQGTGVPLRATVSSFGPILLSKVLGLNDTQESSLGLVFHYADTQGLPLLDLADLKEVLLYLTGDEGKLELKQIGGLSAATVGVILRSLVTLQTQGADEFFGEPEFDTRDLIRTSASGAGVISLLELPNLQDRPQIFSTFLMWVLADLFHDLPEIGDVDVPKLVFFFDEAHLLFDEAPKALLQKIEQVVRLIRSKGVGVFFVTQNPLDIPETVLGQLGNRVQHALRAYTPRDQKAVKAAAETFRPNPALDTAQVITELGVGEALVSFLDEKGRPNMVERAFILPPASQIGPINDAERKQVSANSVVAGVYEKTVDRESAHEIITARLGAAAKEAEVQAQAPKGGPAKADDTSIGGMLGGLFGGSGKRESPVQALVKSAARSIGSQVGREIIRGVLGSILKKR